MSTISYIQMTDKFELLRDKIRNIRNYTVENNSLDIKTDIRIITLEAFDNLIRTFDISSVLLIKFVFDRNWVNSTLKPETDNDFEAIKKFQETYSRNSYIYNLTSIIENYFRIILRNLDILIKDLVNSQRYITMFLKD